VATYKVIQDIEAEDKLLGPFTLRQFIYAIIAIASSFVIFRLSIAHLWYLGLIFVPHTIFFFVLAAPFGHDQPSEVWLLAKIRFFLKPRRRIWDQSGIKELVTITVPKKIEQQLTNGLSQTEVKSRLEALANTIDSRGWAIKNVNVNLFSQPSYVLAQTDSDRLIDPSTMGQEVQAFDITAGDDILDETSSPTAQHFTQLITQSEQTHRKQVLQHMQGGGTAPPSPPDYWFLSQGQQNRPPAGYATFDNTHLVNPGATPATTANLSPQEEKALLDKIHADQEKPKQAGHLKKIPTLAEQKAAAEKERKRQQAQRATPKPATQEAAPAPVNPAIFELANNSDLNVSTIARQAEKATKKQPPDDEVIVKLR
jgi:hypothetical protein